jgi:hypothetical protein
MILSRGSSVHPVIDGLGISKAMHSVVAVTEGHNRRRRHEAKCGESGDHNCHAEARPRAELL